MYMETPLTDITCGECGISFPWRMVTNWAPSLCVHCRIDKGKYRLRGGPYPKAMVLSPNGNPGRIMGNNAAGFVTLRMSHGLVIKLRCEARAGNPPDQP